MNKITVTTITYAEFMALRPIQVITEEPLPTDEPTDIFEVRGPQFDIVRAVFEVAPQHVWTLLEAGDKNYVASGLHYVNRFGYMITKDPAPFEHTEAEVK